MTLREILAERKRASAEQFRQEFFGAQNAQERTETIQYDPFAIFPEIKAWMANFEGIEDF